MGTEGGSLQLRVKLMRGSLDGPCCARPFGFGSPTMAQAKRSALNDFRTRPHRPSLNGLDVLLNM
jgi:hypothetical protein